MKARGLYALVALASTFLLTAPRVPAQTRPKLADYFTEIPDTMLDARYVGGFAVKSYFEDLDGDDQQDMIVLGWDHPASGLTTFAPRAGRVFLGDGNGHFAAAPAALFPVDTLQTVDCRAYFADFNADSRKDTFLACGGWDVVQGPGEQNRLYLSRPEGGWRDATENLPQPSDRTTAGSGLGDLSARGLIDIFVANGNQSLSRIMSYTLLNTGSGQFTQMSANIPVGRGQVLDIYTGSGRNFFTATLADLNDDGRPDLIVGGTPMTKHARILWNRDGVFVQSDMTELPQPAPFPNTGGDTDFKRIDVNQDGLPDLIALGNQNPVHGWYLQVFVNHGNKEFVDETADRVSQGEASGGVEGVETASVRPCSHECLQVLDFNQDGAPDFAVGFQQDNIARLTPGQPVVWLNDGTGHFSTLKVGDFVTAEKENLLGSARLVATRNGYSFLSTNYNGNVGNPLVVRGLLASKPYRITARSLPPRK